MNSDLAELLTDKQRARVVRQLVRELQEPLSVYVWVRPSVEVTGNRWADAVAKRGNHPKRPSRAKLRIVS